MLNTSPNKQTVRSRLSFALLLTLVTSLATAQVGPPKQWDARFGGNDGDHLRSLQQTVDRGYILGGSSYSGISGDKAQASQGFSDYWIVKTDANGVRLWDARFGGSDNDYLVSLEQTVDGGYILGGRSHSGISGDRTQASWGEEDYWIVKTNANGVKQWDVRFGGSNSDWFLSLQQTADGGYILGGTSESGISGDKTQASRGYYDYWIVKTDANGVKQWDVRFGGSSSDFFSSLQQTADGGYILGGYSASGISGDKTQASHSIYYDYWIVKTDANGVKQWDARFGGYEFDYLNSLQQTADGGYILGGTSESGISGDKTQASQGWWDFWIVKTNADGVKQWDARFGGGGIDVLHSLQQTADGGYILGGNSNSGISGDKTQANHGPSYKSDYWILKSDGNGVKQWDRSFGGSDEDYLYSLQQTADGGYILGGSSLSGISGAKTQASQGLEDYWAVKVASEVCSVPANLSVTDITSSSAKLKWDEVYGAEGYKVRYKVYGTNEWTVVFTTGKSKNLNNLSSNTNYTWEVKTFCTIAPGLSSDWSAKQEFTTPLLRIGGESENQISLQIYPNPASDKITVSFLSNEKGELQILNLLGQIVFSKEINSMTEEIDVSKFPNGIYLITATNTTQKFENKFLKQ